MENNFDKKDIPYPKYKSGDRVWIERWDGNIRQGEIEDVNYFIKWNHVYSKPTWEFSVLYSIDFENGSKSSSVKEHLIFKTYEECKKSVDEAIKIKRIQEIEYYTRELRTAKFNVDLYTKRLEKLHGN